MSTYVVLRVVVLLLVLLPLASAAVVPALGRAARRVAMLVALLHLGLTAPVVAMVIPAIDYRQEQESQARGDENVQPFRPEFVPGDTGARNNSDGSEGRTHWTLLRLSAADSPRGLPAPHVQFFLGIDGLNMWLLALASFMLVPVILVSWDSVTERPGAYYGWLLLLQAGLVGCFLSFDVILFYVFFELTLIPSFFLIGRWGVGSGRRDAARKFFLYTLAGSLLTLLGVVGVALTNPTPLDHAANPKRVNNAVVKREGPTALPGEWVMAKRGPVTFSLPDLMVNVQVWANVEATAKIVLSNSEIQLTAARAQDKTAAEQLKDEEARLKTARDAKAPAAEIQAAEGRVNAARTRAQGTAAIAGAAERQLASAKSVMAEAEQLRAKNVESQFWLFVALIAGFLVKVPVWPFHTWLPAAYDAAPTGVVITLSAVMAKLGTFGILRLVLPLVPDAAITYGLPVVGALAAFGIVYAALCAYASRDMKLLLAYSSVSHLGFVALALFAFNVEGLTGATLHMVNHGLSTGALFATLGFFVARYGTTEMPRFGGLMGRFPTFAVLTFVLCLASVGLPGLNNFVSEMMMIAGLFEADNPGVRGCWPAVVAAASIFLSAWYTLTMLARVFFNPLKEPEPLSPGTPPRDVTRREFFALGTLAGLCLLLGLFPQPVVETMKPDVRVLANIGDAARARARGIPYVSKEPPVPRQQAPAEPEPKGKQGGKKDAKKDNKDPKGPNPKGPKGPKNDAEDE